MPPDLVRHNLCVGAPTRLGPCHDEFQETKNHRSSETLFKSTVSFILLKARRTLDAKVKLCQHDLPDS